MPDETKRKIIQIAASQTESGDDIITYSLYALCDDGTVWDYRWEGMNSHWMKMADIPQDG
jgi:hypothetical protein